jgi:hypothetical protein
MLLTTFNSTMNFQSHNPWTIASKQAIKDMIKSNYINLYEIKYNYTAKIIRTIKQLV